MSTSTLIQETTNDVATDLFHITSPERYQGDLFYSTCTATFIFVPTSPNHRFTENDPTFSPYSYHSQLIERDQLCTKIKSDLFNKLDSYLLFSKNWDGYGGKPPSKKTVADVHLFLEKLHDVTKIPSTGLSGDGEISLYWKDNGIYVDIGFTGNREFSYYARNSVGDEFFGDNKSLSSDLPNELIQILKNS